MKPCPFRGSDAPLESVKVSEGSESTVAMECPTCHSRGPTTKLSPTFNKFDVPTMLEQGDLCDARLKWDDRA